MNKELYILIGISVFAFLIGQKIRAKIKPSANNKKAAKTRKSITRENPQQLLKKEKFKSSFSNSIVTHIWFNCIYDTSSNQRYIGKRRELQSKFDSENLDRNFCPLYSFYRNS